MKYNNNLYLDLIKDKSINFKASASKTSGFLILLANTLNNLPVSSFKPAPGPINTASTLFCLSPSINLSDELKRSKSQKILFRLHQL